MNIAIKIEDKVKELVVVAGILQNEGKVLIAKRHASKSLGGKWEFAGGKVEEGETQQQALRRELFEEFGLALEIGEYVGSNTHDYPTFRIHLHAYKVPCRTEQVVSKDHEQVRWVRKADLLSYDLAEADIPLVRLID